jgi:C-type lysozyme/alpha-lactalbumin family
VLSLIFLEFSETNGEPVTSIVELKNSEETTTMKHDEKNESSENHALLKLTSSITQTALLDPHLMSSEYATIIPDANFDYKKCELAKDMMGSHRFNQSLISTFICIAIHESNLNESFVANYDEFSKYGLFQIDDRDFCSTNTEIHECDVHCAHLNDNNNDNDFECALFVHSKRGFNYWPSYSQHCSNVDPYELDYCYAPTPTSHRPFTVINDEIFNYQLGSTSPTTKEIITTTSKVAIPSFNYTGIIFF